MQSATIQHFKRINPELLLWPLALVVLTVMQPERPYVSFCPLKWIGVPFCPGCGLGRSVSYLLHGNFSASWQLHKLGLPALLILGHRSITLAIDQYKTIKTPI